MLLRLLTLSILSISLFGCNNGGSCYNDSSSNPLLLSNSLLKDAGLSITWQNNIPLKCNESVSKFFVVDKYLYVITNTNTLLCIDRANGKVRFVKKFAPALLPVEEPVKDGENLYFTVGLELLRLNPTTGELVKEYDFSETPTAPIAMNKENYYIAGPDMFVHCVNRDQEYAVYRVSSCTWTPIVSIGVTESILVMVTSEGNVFATSPRSAIKYWRFDLGGQVRARALYKNNSIYLASLDSNIYKLSLSRGTLEWKTPLGDELSSKPVLAGDLLYVYASKQGLYAISPDDGKIVWQEKDGQRLLSRSKPRSYVFTKSKEISVMDNNTGKDLYKLDTSVVDYVATNTFDSSIYVMDKTGKLLRIDEID